MNIIKGYALCMQKAIIIEDETKIEKIEVEKNPHELKSDLIEIQNEKSTLNTSSSFFGFLNRSSKTKIPTLKLQVEEKKMPERNSSVLQSFWNAFSPPTNEKNKGESVTKGGTNGSHTNLTSPRTLTSPRLKTPRERTSLGRHESSKNSFNQTKVIQLTTSFFCQTFNEYITLAPKELEKVLKEEIKKDLESNFSCLEELKPDLCKLFSQYKTLPKEVKTNNHITFLFYNTLRKQFKLHLAVDEFSGNLTCILSEEKAKACFTKYLEDRKCPESMYFLNAVDAFKEKALRISDQNRMFAEIYNLYILEDSKTAINIGSDVRNEFKLVFDTIERNTNNLSTVFDHAYMTIKSELKNETKKDAKLFKESVHFKTLCKELKIEL